MALPEREEFDLEGAADYLGCGVDDVVYYLHKGAIRLGINRGLGLRLCCPAGGPVL